MSPCVHKAALVAGDIDAEYFAYSVPAGIDEFRSFIGRARSDTELALHGLSVTLPHKSNALEVADCADSLAVEIGAANTLVMAPDGSIRASNTDYAAVLDALGEALDPDETLASRSVLVLGAGGAARAAVAGLTNSGSSVVIANRTRERADELAMAFGAKAIDWVDRSSANCDIIVNSTRVGMAPNASDTPFDASAFDGTEIVFDMVYSPLDTRLLRGAKAAGCVVVSGAEMFVRQAASQFELFTGREAPYHAMIEALMARLA